MATIVTGEKGEIIVANQLVEQLFGYPAFDLIGRSVDTLMPEHFRGRHARHRASYAASPTLQPMEERRELIALTEDGREFPAEITLNPLHTQDGLLVLATIRDITQRRTEEQKLIHSQKQLHELSASLISLRDRERSQLSRTIHDELGQAMTSLKLDIAWLQRQLEPDQQALFEKAEAMCTLLDQSIHSIREISTELRPGILDDIGLEAAVEWQLQQFQQRTGIRCTVNSNFQDCFADNEEATTMYCILKEALTNIARHAQANQVQVSLKGNADSLDLEVSDDGRGITPAEIHHPQSIGLLGMRERARMHGGTLIIEGASGEGSTVTAHLPLPVGEETRK